MTDLFPPLEPFLVLLGSEQLFALFLEREIKNRTDEKGTAREEETRCQLYTERESAREVRTTHILSSADKACLPASHFSYDFARTVLAGAQ